MKYITNLSNNPHYNLAFEEYCFKNLPREEDYVILWINGPAIIVGKNQNTVGEINQRYVEKNNIQIVRRVTGGGAVYHDLGNLNFSLISNQKGDEKIDFKEINVPILKSLEKLGVKAEFTGRNDLTVDGKKMSGIAQSVHRKRILNHGTILFDTDLTVLSDALNVKADKIESKGVKSVKSRVTNIKPYLEEDADIFTFKDVLLKNIFEYHNEPMEELILSDDQKAEIDKLYEERYSKWEWNYGESPDFTYKNYKRYPFGSLEIGLKVRNGEIIESKIYGDFFGVRDVSELEEKLNGQRYERKSLEESLKNEPFDKYFGAISTEEFVDLLFD